MIEAVATFAVVTAIAEMVILMNMPAFRRWVLRTHGREFMLHIAVMVLNLWIHWGTVTGTMTGVTSFLVSMVVCRMMVAAFGRHQRA